MKYDIRTKESAEEFIKEFLEIDNKQLEDILEKYEKDEDFFEKNYISKIESRDINELKIYGYHVTTNPDNCKSIKSEGIKNLQEVLKGDNEFTNLLLEQQIRFDIGNSKMFYKDEVIDINYNKMLKEKMMTRSKSVARKIYFDYCVNGFFSGGDRYIRETEIFLYPEVLKNIEECIEKNLTEFKDKWKKICKTYRITFKVDIVQINCIDTFYFDETSPQNIKINMIKKAISRINNEKYEDYIYLKNHEQIYNNQIICIEIVDR